jgi:hypothetical protein
MVNSEELIGTKKYLTAYAGCHKNLRRYNRFPRCVCVCVCVCETLQQYLRVASLFQEQLILALSLFHTLSWLQLTLL